MRNAPMVFGQGGTWEVRRAPSAWLFGGVALLGWFLRRRHAATARRRLLGIARRALGQQLGTGFGPGLGQQLLLFRPALHRPRFTTSGPVADLLLAQATQQLRTDSGITSRNRPGP